MYYFSLSSVLSVTLYSITGFIYNKARNLLYVIHVILRTDVLSTTTTILYAYYIILYCIILMKQPRIVI